MDFTNYPVMFGAIKEKKMKMIVFFIKFYQGN